MNEKMKILIAYDGSDCADNAINELPRAGLPRDAEALIVNVQESWLSPPSGDKTTKGEFSSNEPTAAKLARVKEPEVEKLDDESPVIAKAYRQLKEYFPDWKIETLSLTGSPSQQITNKAKEWEADLVVVGSQGITQNKLVSLGSVSQKVAGESHCSVRVVRGSTWKKGAPTRILIALDGAYSAQMAVEEVARRMWMMGSEVRLVTAKNPSEGIQNNEEEARKTDAWISSFTEKARKTLKESALGVSQLVEEGDPKQIIVRAADEWGADCIFIGSNDKASFHDNILLGSVATATVARASCTVEIVRYQEKS